MHTNKNWMSNNCNFCSQGLTEERYHVLTTQFQFLCYINSLSCCSSHLLLLNKTAAHTFFSCLFSPKYCFNMCYANSVSVSAHNSFTRYITCMIQWSLETSCAYICVVDLPKVETDHVDHGNPHTFEIEDLKKLIKKVSLVFQWKSCVFRYGADIGIFINSLCIRDCKVWGNAKGRN